MHKNPISLKTDKFICIYVFFSFISCLPLISFESYIDFFSLLKGSF